MVGNLWFIAAAALTAGVLLLLALRRASRGADCCARSRPGASPSAGGAAPTSHSSLERARSGLSLPTAPVAEDAGSEA